MAVGCASELVLAGKFGSVLVIDIGIRVKMGHRARTQSYSADAVIDSVRADVGFEVSKVASVGIRDEEVAATGLDRETQVDRANVREVTVYGEGCRLDFNNVVVGHGVLNDVCLGRRIIKVARIYDEAYLRWRREVRIRGRRLRRCLANRYEGCVISGKGEGGIQLCAVVFTAIARGFSPKSVIFVTRVCVTRSKTAI